MKKKGVTLIELTLIMVIVGVLAGGTASFIYTAVDTWSFLSFRNNLASQTRLALDFMVREIREIKDNKSISYADKADLRFVDSQGNSIRYWVQGTTLLRNTDLLAEGIKSFQFEYLRKNNRAIPTPVSPGSRKDIWRIKVTLTIQSGRETLSLKSDIHPRNFSLL